MTSFKWPACKEDQSHVYKLARPPSILYACLCFSTPRVTLCVCGFKCICYQKQWWKYTRTSQNTSPFYQYISERFLFYDISAEGRGQSNIGLRMNRFHTGTSTFTLWPLIVWECDFAREYLRVEAMLVQNYLRTFKICVYEWMCRSLLSIRLYCVYVYLCIVCGEQRHSG